MLAAISLNKTVCSRFREGPHLKGVRQKTVEEPDIFLCTYTGMGTLILTYKCIHKHHTLKKIVTPDLVMFCYCNTVTKRILGQERIDLAHTSHLHSITDGSQGRNSSRSRGRNLRGKLPIG